MKDPTVAPAEKSKSEASTSASAAVSHVFCTAPEQVPSTYPNPGVIELWCGSLATNAENLRLFSSLLSDAELERAARFKRATDAEKYRVAHGTLRCVLAAALNTNPALIEFDTGKFGKPTLKKFSTLHFNLSHCEKYMVIALSADGPIGVDVEQHNRTTSVDAIARKHFSSSENSMLQECVGQARLEKFFSLWTKKEAVVKALGTGISQDLTDLPSEQRLIEDGWFIKELDTRDLFECTNDGATHNTDQASAAVAIKHNAISPALRIHRWDWT